MDERMIPEAALRDSNSVELIRVWIAENQMHCSMKIGMYQETTNIPETRAWGIILADITRHLSNALENSYQLSKSEVIEEIRESFAKELSQPTSEAQGDFQ